MTYDLNMYDCASRRDGHRSRCRTQYQSVVFQEFALKRVHGVEATPEHAAADILNGAQPTPTARTLSAGSSPHNEMRSLLANPSDPRCKSASMRLRVYDNVIISCVYRSLSCHPAYTYIGSH